MLIHEQQVTARPRPRPRPLATLLGRSLDVSPQVVPAVERANAYFASDRLTEAERAEVESSIVSLRGSGRTVVVNQLLATGQNVRASQLDEPQARRIALFEHVVRREPTFSAFDAWAETDWRRWLDANRLFNFHFPLFLSELLDEVAGGESNTVLAEWAEAFDWIAGTTTLVGRAMVSALDAADLVTAAADAGRTETAMWLERLAADWDAVRAWIEGVVVYGDGTHALLCEHEREVAAGTEKRTPVGELHGMIPLHPKLVETLEAGGWRWSVGRPGAKAFMHFDA